MAAFDILREVVKYVTPDTPINFVSVSTAPRLGDGLASSAAFNLPGRDPCCQESIAGDPRQIFIETISSAR
jgi:hypothetical protein